MLFKKIIKDPEAERTAEGIADEAEFELEHGKEEKEHAVLSRFRLSRMLDRLTAWFLAFITAGFFGMLFTAYSREESFIRKYIEKRKKQRRVHRQPKYTDHRVASFTERIFLTSFLKKTRYVMMKAPVGYYAEAVIAYTILSLIVNYLVLFLSGAPSLYEGFALSGYALESLQVYLADPHFWVNASLLILVIVFILPVRRCSLQEIKTGSLFLSSFFERLLGAKGELPEELQGKRFEHARDQRGNRGVRLITVLLGALLGVLSAFVSPFYILLVPLLLLLVAIVVRTPEAGLVLSVLLLPVLTFTGRYDSLYVTSLQDMSFGDILSAVGIPTLSLAALVLFTGLAYLLKVLRKKRLFRFGLLDGAVLLVGLTVLLYGIFPSADAASFTEVLITVILLNIYFLAVNLMRTEAWINRVLAVLQFTMLLSLTAGIVVYYFGIPHLGWLPTEHLTGEIGNVAALFGGEDVLGAYLVMMFPLALGTVFTARSAVCKIFAAMCLPEILFVALLMSTKLPFMFCIFGLFIFTLFCTYKALYAVPLAVCGAGVAYQLFPNGISLTVFLKSLFRETFGQGVYLWDRLFTVPYELSLMGEGFGRLRFSELFAMGDQNVEAGFWMRALFGLGIPGLSVLFVFVLVFSQMCFEELRFSTGSHLRIGIAGGFAAIALMLPYGFFMPIFTDFRITFLFWLTVGIVTSYRQISAGRRSDRSFLRQDPMTGRNADTIVY